MNFLKYVSVVNSCLFACTVFADAGWVIRSYGDNTFFKQGGLWTNKTDSVCFDANRMPRPAKSQGISFLARTGFVTESVGKHTFSLAIAERDHLGHFIVVDGRNMIEFPDGIELGAGHHTLAVYLRGAPLGTSGLPWGDFSVVMDGEPMTGLAFDNADETAEAVVYDRVFDMKDGKKIWSPTWRTFEFDIAEDGLYEFPVRYREFPRYTRIWLDDVQILYNQGRSGVDTRNSFLGDLDRTERTDRQRINFFGEDRAVRFLKKGRHSIDLYAHWGPWLWDDEMDSEAPDRVIFGMNRLKGINPESDTGFWIEGTDKSAFATGEKIYLVAQSAAKEQRNYVLEAWRSDGITAEPERINVPFSLKGGNAVKLALPTSAEGEWRYTVKNARGETMDGPWEYAVIGNARVADNGGSEFKVQSSKLPNSQTATVVDFVDCVEGRGGVHDFRERGESKIVETKDGAYRRVGPNGLGNVSYKWIKPQKGLRPVEKDEKPDVTYTTHDWYAYSLKVKNPGHAHVLRCQVPNDEYRVTTVVAYDRKTRNYNGFGMVSGDAPASGAFSNLDIFLWPNSDIIDVMVINSEGNHGSKLNRAGAVRSMELIEYPNGLPALEEPVHGWNKKHEFGFRGEQVDLGINERSWPDFVGTKCVTNTFPNAYSWRPFIQAWDRFGQIAAWRGDNLCQFPIFTYMMVQFQVPEMKLLSTGSDRYTADDRGGQEMIDRSDRDLFLVMLMEASKYNAKIMADFMIQNISASTVSCWANRYNTHTNGMMLSSSADGKPYRTFSGATFPNPAHPAVRKAYVEFCEGIGKRYGKYSAFAGISHRFWPRWPASFESWFHNENIGYDDFTVGEFSKATGIRFEPVGNDPEKFNARREELKTRWRREWFDWRGQVCLSLREEMLAGLRKYAPDAKFLISNKHEVYKQTAQGSGLDSELFTGRRDLGMLDNRATVGLGGDTHGTEINRLDPVCFAEFDRRPIAERNPPIDEWTKHTMSFPQGACCDGSMRPYPYNLEPAAMALADNKLEYLMSFGNWTLPAADEKLREFVQAYRAIPDGVDWQRFALPGGLEAPVALWYGEKNGELVFWIVNRTDSSRTVEIGFDRKSAFEDYVTGMAVKEIRIPPFGVRVFSAKGDKTITSVKIPMPAEERISIEKDLEFIQSMRPFAAEAREVKQGAGAQYYDTSRTLGRYDLSWTFADLVGPMEQAAAEDNWHEVRRLIGDFKKNHVWWYEAFGWPDGFCKVRDTGRAPLAGFLCNRWEIAFKDTSTVAKTELPYAKDAFLTAAKDVDVNIHVHGYPGGRQYIELTGVFGGGYGDIEVTANGMNCGTIRSTSVVPRLETRRIAVDFPHSGHGNDFILKAKGEKGLAVLSFGQCGLPGRPLDRWMAIGPFDKVGGTRDMESYAKTFPPEEEIDFSKTYSGGVGGKELKWQEIDVKGRRTIDLMDWTPYDLMGENGVTYMVTYVKAKQTCSTTLSYSCDYFGTIWVNGNVIVPELNGPLGCYNSKEIQLKAGWNEIKVKTACGSSQRWYFAGAIGDDGTFEYSVQDK